MLTPEDHIAGLTQMIAGHAGVKRLLLFGSRARGYASSRSDIDLAVDVEEPFDWWRLQDAVDDYPTLLKIDLICLMQEHGEFRNAILQTGRVLYEVA